MPKSRLKIEGLQLSDIESLQATKTEVSVGIVNGVKAPRFIQEEVSPSIRQTDSLQTDEVVYGTQVKWVLSRKIYIWAKAYGESGDDTGMAVAIADNGDIIVAGYTNSFGAGDYDFLVLRLDESGDIKWQKAYGGSDRDLGYAVAIAGNGDIIVAGQTSSFGAGGDDFWILRLDSNGNIKWQKAYGGSSNDRVEAVAIAENGDIIIAGRTYSFGAGNYDFWVLRLDENGNIKWQKAYGGSSYENLHAVTVAPNGDIVVVGRAESFGAGGDDFWVLRLDENGNIKWQKAYGGSSTDIAEAVAIADNGDIIVAGWTNSFGAGDYDVWVLRLDENGNVKWQKAYGGSDSDGAIDVTIADNGDIIVAGWTYSFGVEGTDDIWILRLDENGNIKWQKAYGGNNSDGAEAVVVTENGDIIVAGWTNSFGVGDYDLLVLKLDENGNVPTSVLTVTDTNCTVTDTNCTVTDTNCIVTDTDCTVTDTNCIITETDCVVTEL